MFHSFLSQFGAAQQSATRAGTMCFRLGYAGKFGLYLWLRFVGLRVLAVWCFGAPETSGSEAKALQ